MSLTIVLLILALILFLLSALSVGSPRFDRFSFMAAGLALWVLSALLNTGSAK